MKTTDLLTFFQPGSSDGTTWTFTLRNDDDLVAQLWVFSRGGEDLSQFARAGASTQEELQPLLRELHKIVEPRGGVILYAREQNGAIRLDLKLVLAKGYDPPRFLLRLSPVGNPGFQSFSDRIDLEVGDHLVVPVSADAEARLKAFYQDVQDLPPDLQSSVLNVIRRPSLEWRVERIERALRLMPATRFDQKAGSAHQRRFLAKLSYLFMRPFPIGPVVALVLVLMAGTLFAYDKFSQSVSTEIGPTGANPPEPAPTSENPPAVTQAVPLTPEAAFGVLFNTLSTSTDPAVNTLFSSHFKDSQKDLFKSKEIAWGITKLQALELGLLAKSSPALDNLDAWSATEKVYRDKDSPNRPISQLNGKALALLAYTWCQLDASKPPSLPRTDTYSTPLPLQDNCEVNDADVVLGLGALTAWVRQQKPAKLGGYIK